MTEEQQFDLMELMKAIEETSRRKGYDLGYHDGYDKGKAEGVSAIRVLQQAYAKANMTSPS